MPSPAHRAPPPHPRGSPHVEHARGSPSQESSQPRCSRLRKGKATDSRKHSHHSGK